MSGVTSADPTPSRPDPTDDPSRPSSEPTAEFTERAEHTERSEHAERSGHAEHAERTERSEHTEHAEHTERSEHAETTERAERTEEVEKPTSAQAPRPAQRVRVRRAVNFKAFLIAGALVGLVIGAAVEIFGPAARLSETGTIVYTPVSTFSFLTVFFAFFGLLAGGVVALVLDRRR